jgi:hypothetical protein
VVKLFLFETDIISNKNPSGYEEEMGFLIDLKGWGDLQKRIISSGAYFTYRKACLFLINNHSKRTVSRRRK